MARYQIWDKTSNVITPIGENLTPAQWIERYPVAGIDGIKFIVGGGVINGAYAGEYTSMIEVYTKAGCDFTNCITDQDHLDAIEVFEDTRNAVEADVTAEERIAAALEYQNLLSM